MKQLEKVQEFVNHVYWMLVLLGVFFVALAILILLYPPLLVALVAATFAVVGVSLFVAAYKVNQVWRRVPWFLKK